MDEFVNADGILHEPLKVMTSAMEGIYLAYMKATFDDFENRRQDLERFIRFGAQFPSVEEMLNELSLLSGPEAAESAAEVQDKSKLQDKESVTLSSVHQAKGLEWKVVFIIWLTDSCSRICAPPKRMVVRAWKRSADFSTWQCLRRWISCISRGRAFGQGYSGDAWQMQSRFLDELPPGSVEEWRVRP